MTPTPTSEAERAAVRTLEPFRGWYRLRRILRIGVPLLALAGFLYIRALVDVVQLPEEGCTAISAYTPGLRLVVSPDPAPESLFLGDVVFYETPAGALTYGRITAPPGAPEGTLRASTGYWIVADCSACEAPDSSDHGPVDPADVRARVLFALEL